VQAVMIGLCWRAVWVWMIIVSFSMRMGKVRRAVAAFEAEFWEHDDPER
jgi:biopolymer transport protein TolQ